MSLNIGHLLAELTSSSSAHECLEILAATPPHLGFDVVGFREEMARPIAPRLPDRGARDGRFGWPNGFMERWIAEGHGRHFPIAQLMQKPDVACQWALPGARPERGALALTDRQWRSVQYMRSFGIDQGLTVPVRLPFGRTACVTWFASEDRQLTIDTQTMDALQIAAQRFFDGIDRSRLWTAASPLSARETECLHWAARGLSDKKIARVIERSVDTVAFHIKSATRKLDAVNRTHAVALAVRAALIEPSNAEPFPAMSDPGGR
ncbi:MAG: autoinducer binding domain-containing protein [Pseudomonadales bacterium]|nr:autoinducer binding domain-containing protein [Pseudomonadales bacterium]